MLKQIQVLLDSPIQKNGICFGECTGPAVIVYLSYAFTEKLQLYGQFVKLYGLSHEARTNLWRYFSQLHNCSFICAVVILVPWKVLKKHAAPRPSRESRRDAKIESTEKFGEEVIWTSIPEVTIESACA